MSFLSVGGGREVVWARTGELFYRNEARDRLLAVSVTTQPTLRVGVPKEVLTGRFAFLLVRDSGAFVLPPSVDARRNPVVKDEQSANRHHSAE